MNRRSIFFILFSLVMIALIVIFASGVSENEAQQLLEEVEGMELDYETEVLIRLDQVGYFIYDDYGEEESSLFFDFYIDRPDLGLEEPSNDPFQFYSYDLPEEQHLATLNLSIPASYEIREYPEPYGYYSCERNSFPHRCEVDSPGSYILEIGFVDGGYAMVNIEVPQPPYPDLPVLIEPSKAPEQGATLSMSFPDIGAYEYWVEANLCGFYQNDGINPCLDGQQFWVVQDEVGEWNIDSEWKNPTITHDSGNGLFTVASDLEMVYESSVMYRVCGYFQGEQDGIKTFAESCSSQEFER